MIDRNRDKDSLIVMLNTRIDCSLPRSGSQYITCARSRSFHLQLWCSHVDASLRVAIRVSFCSEINKERTHNLLCEINIVRL